MKESRIRSVPSNFANNDFYLPIKEDPDDDNESDSDSFYSFTDSLDSEMEIGSTEDNESEPSQIILTKLTFK